jgi:DNA-binding MarR family transcriptional regulator
MRSVAMEAQTPTDLAVVLHDLAWLLPRTIGRESDPGYALPASELEIMRLLVRRPGLSVNDTAAELRLAPANVSTALRALEARGLLERRRDPADGRVVRLHPTEAALTHRSDQERAWGGALAAALNALPKAEAKRTLAATGSLRALAAVLGREAAR